MTDSMKYYVAGIIDGEGTVTMGIKRDNSKFRMPIISVSSTTLAILTFMKERYGGSISTHKVYKEHHKQSWSWKVTYNGAIRVCNDIDGILLEPDKQRRVSLLINKYPLVTKRNGKYSASEIENKREFEREFFQTCQESGYE
jgi:hypothetical protein